MWDHGVLRNRVVPAEEPIHPIQRESSLMLQFATEEEMAPAQGRSTALPALQGKLFTLRRKCGKPSCRAVRQQHPMSLRGTQVSD